MDPQVFHRGKTLEKGAESESTCYAVVSTAHPSTDPDVAGKCFQHNTLARRCSCGRPSPISLRRVLCAVCRRAQRHARAIDTRIALIVGAH